MARSLYDEKLPPEGCHVTLADVGDPNAGPDYAPDPSAPYPGVRVGRGGLAVLTRCPDFGDVRLEVWAGDPGPPPPDWATMFSGALTTTTGGFDAGTGLGSTFHMDAPPGAHAVRVDASRDQRGLVDAVRFVFPDGDDLAGHAVGT